MLQFALNDCAEKCCQLLLVLSYIPTLCKCSPQPACACAVESARIAQVACTWRDRSHNNATSVAALDQQSKLESLVEELQELQPRKDAVFC